MNRTTAPRRAAVLVGLLATALGLVLGTAAPALAHGGPGKIDVESVTPQPDGRTVDVRVRVTYAGDGDPVADATVTVTGERPGAGGASPGFTPVTLAAGEEDGTFAGRVTLPAAGDWTLRITSVEPPASVTAPVPAAVTGLPTVVSTTSPAAPTTSPATVAPPTTAPPTTAPPTTAAAAGSSTEPESGRNLLVSVVVATIVGAVVASGVAVARSRRSATPSDPSAGG